MNIERLLREVDGRLEGRDEELRRTVLDAVREAIDRDRRRVHPSPTVEAERERRLDAEESREIVEAIDRPASMQAALAEALKQAARVIEVDAAAVLAYEKEGVFRVEAARGAESDRLAGTLLTDSGLSTLAQSRVATSVSGTQAGDPALPLPITTPMPAWAALPMLHEGKSVGLLVLARRTLSAFGEEDLRRARRIAFTAAAVLARGQTLQQVRRYAAMLEQVVETNERVFRGDTLEALGQAVLDGACRVGGYRGGLLVLATPHGPRVAAAVGEALSPALGRPAPSDLTSAVPRRLAAERMLEVAEALGVVLPAGETHLVPLATSDAYVGCLTLLDPAEPGPDDRLIEAFASRAAAAWRHAAQQHR